MAVDIPVRYQIDKSAIRQVKSDFKDIEKSAESSEGAVGDLNKSIGESISQSTKLNTSFAGMGKLLGGLGLAITFKEGVEQMARLVAETQKFRKEVAQLTGTSGADLDRLTAQIKALADTFGADFNEILIAVNANSKQFQISQQEAFDEVARGFTEGADAAGEYLSILQEYPALYKEANFSLKEFVDLQVLAARAGTFNDYGAAVIEEATIRLRELPKATADALEGIGLDSRQIQKDLESGATSIKDIIIDISRQLDTLPPQSQKVGTAIADIFGEAGEKTGLQFLTTLQDIDGALEDVSSEQKAYTEQSEAQLEAQTKLNEELVRFSNQFKGLGTAISTFLADTGANLLRWTNAIIDVFKGAESRAEDFAASLSDSLSQDEVVNAIAEAGQRIADLQQERENLQRLIDAGIEYQAGQNYVAQLSDTNKALDIMKGTYSELIEQLKTFALGQEDSIGPEPTEQLTEAQRNLVTQYRSLIDANRDFSTALTQTELEKLQKKLDETELSAIRARNSIEKIGDPRVLDKLLEDLEQTKEEIRTLGLDEVELLNVNEAREQADELFKIKQDRLNKETEAAKQQIEEERQLRIRVAEEIASATISITQSIADFNAGLSDRRLQELEEFEEKRLDLVRGNAQAEERVLAETDAKRRAILRRQAVVDKAAGVFNSIINTAIAVSRALSSAPPPLNAVLAAAAGVAGATQTAAIVAQPIPRYKKGVSSVPGPNVNDDVVHAMLTPGERVVPREHNKKYFKAYELLEKSTMPAELIESFLQNPEERTARIAKQLESLRSPAVMAQEYLRAGGSVASKAFDEEKLADLLARKLKDNPTTIFNMDYHGFSVGIKEKASLRQKDANEFRM